MNQFRRFRRTMLGAFLQVDHVKSQRRQGRKYSRSRIGASIERLEERALLSGVPFQSFESSHITGLLETGTDWEFDFADWNGDGTKDMFAINKQGTSGTTEVSILDGATGYQSFLEVELQTPIGHTDANWTFEVADWGGNGQLDLFAINRDFGGTTGVTVVSGFENPGTIPSTKPFTTFIGGLTTIPTVLHQTDASWEFQVADWNGDGIADIFAFDKTGAVVNGTQRTDLHVISGSGLYQAFIYQTSTVLPATNNSWDLLLGGNNDIVAIKKNGTATNTTEVHVPTVTNGFQSYFLQTSTALHETNANWQFEFKDATGDANDDLIAIATNGTASGRTEVFVLTGLQEPPPPGATVSLPTTDGGTVEGTIDAGAGTLLIDLDGNDVTVPASLAGNEIVLQGPGTISFEGASNAGELLVHSAGFQLISGAQINGDRLVLNAGSELVIPPGVLNVSINTDVDINNNSVATINANVPMQDVNVTQASEIAIAAGGHVHAKSVHVSGNSQATVSPAGTLGINTSLNVDATSHLLVNGNVNGAVNVEGELSGSGQINGPVAVGNLAIVLPGNSPGRLRTGNLQATSGSRFVFELLGATPGSQYDQIDVTGTVQLGGATLQPILDFSPALGQQFVIIRNDGSDAVSGTFQGLPEGASLDIGGKRFHITYQGGTGNDVVLQRNQRPSGSSVSRSADEDVVLTGTVAHSDPDAESTTVQLVSGPAHAAAFSLNSNGSFSYRPDEHFSGADSFRYRVSDGELLSSIYTVAIDVEPVADAPTLTVQDASGNENAQIPLNISASLVDQDGSESLSLQISGVPSGVVLNQGIDLDDGVWSLTRAQLSGLAIQSPDNQSFTFNVAATAREIGNHHTATTSKSVSVSVGNVPPTLTTVADQTIAEGTLLAISDIGRFTDPGFENATAGTDETFTYSIAWGDGTAADTGTATVDSAGSFSSLTQGSFDGSHIYTKDGTDTVAITVTDDDGGATTVERLRHNQLRPGGSLGDIGVLLGGTLEGTYMPSGRLLAFGQAGDDDIQVAGSMSLSAWLYGDAGNDRLKGGAGHDVLIGGLGDDLLLGGRGRDLMIGGRGADRIVGNADDDILIAGYTAFDYEYDYAFADRPEGMLRRVHNEAFSALLNEWLSPRAYFTRIENLSGVGQDQPRENGDFFLRSEDDPLTSENEQTVYADGAPDFLTGAQGDDWFFFDPDKDKDKATDLRDEVFANDLSWINGE